MRQWTAAGFPKKKLLLGLALYGYVSKSGSTRLAGQRAKATQLVADAAKGVGVELGSGGGEEGRFLEYAHDRTEERMQAEGAAAGAQIVAPTGSITVVPRGALASGDLSSRYNQQIAFKDILSSGALVKSGAGYVGGNGYTRGASVTTPYYPLSVLIQYSRRLGCMQYNPST